MPRLAEFVLTQALPYYLRIKGFKLYQESQDILVLEHDGDIICRYPADVTVATLVRACEDYGLWCS